MTNFETEVSANPPHLPLVEALNLDSPAWLNNLVDYGTQNRFNRLPAIIWGLSGAGKTAIKAELAESISCHPQVRSFQDQSNQELEIYTMTTGNAIALARGMGLIKQELGYMSRKDYREVERVWLRVYELTKRYLPVPSLVLYEGVGITGLPRAKGGEKRYQGMPRGIELAARAIDDDPKTSTLVVVGSGNLAMRSFDQRDELAQANTSSEVQAVLKKYGMIDYRDWREIKRSYQQTGNRLVYLQQLDDIYRFAFQLWRQNVINLAAPSKEESSRFPEFSAYFDQEIEQFSQMLAEELIPYQLQRLYQSPTVPIEAAVFRNKVIKEASIISGSARLKGLIEGLVAVSEQPIPQVIRLRRALGELNLPKAA